MSQRIVTSQPTWTADIYRNYGLFAVYNGYALPTDYSSFRSNPYIPTAVQINLQNLRPTRVLHRYGSAWHLSSDFSRHVVDVAAPTQCYGLSVLMVLNPRGAIVWDSTQILYKSTQAGGSLLNYNYSTKVLDGAIREGNWDTPTPVIATTSVDLTNGGILIHRWNAGSSTYVTWFNGQELTQSYSSSGTPSFAKSNGVFQIGEYGNYRDLMPFALFAAANQYWDDATASKLTLNPWQIFRPQSARIYSFSTGAASSTVPPLYHQRQQQGMAS